MTAPEVKIGQDVHYTSFGTPGGEYDKACRAATVTEMSFHDPELTQQTGEVGLAVVNPTGLFFRPLSEGGCAYNGEARPSGRAGGTWHLPEDCGR